MESEKLGIKHILFMFGVKFVLQKNSRGYKGYFVNPQSENPPTMLFMGYTFKQALSRLCHKAMHQGLISLEDFNMFTKMDWKTPLDISVWGKMNKLNKVGDKHYFVSFVINPDQLN